MCLVEAVEVFQCGLPCMIDYEGGERVTVCRNVCVWALCHVCYREQNVTQRAYRVVFDVCECTQETQRKG